MRTKPKLRLLLVAAIGLTTLALATPGHSAVLTCNHHDSATNGTNGASASDSATCVVEPILSKSSAAQIYVNDADPDGLASANIKSISATSGGGALTFVITAAGVIPTSANDFLPGGPIRAPYGGVHYLAQFKTDWLGQVEIVGTDANTGIPIDSRIGSPGDNIQWFVSYGLTASEGGEPDCTLGYYDPNGTLVGGTPHVPPPFGQSWVSLIQKKADAPIAEDANKPQINCSASGHSVTITVPYVAWRCSHLNAACRAYKAGDIAAGKFAANPSQAYTIAGNPGCGSDGASGARPGCGVDWGALPSAPGTFTNKDELAHTGAPVGSSNIARVYDLKAFTWMDHEIGAPIVDTPAGAEGGLIFGFTWYTDALPSTSYNQGLISQDPSVSAFAIDAECVRRQAIGGVRRNVPVVGPVDVAATYVKNPLFTGLYGQCYQPNPTGPQFQGGLHFTAL